MAHMELPDVEKVIKTGTFLYDEVRACKVRIVQTNLRPGSGDEEEADEWREDQHGIFFRVDYSPPHSERFSAGGGYFSTIDEAIRTVVNSVKGVIWDS